MKHCHMGDVQSWWSTEEAFAQCEDKSKNDDQIGNDAK